MPLREKVLDYVGEEVQVGGGVALGEDDGVEVGGRELLFHISGVFLADLHMGEGEKRRVGGRGSGGRRKGGRGPYNLPQIIQRKATRNGVDPHGILSHPRRAWLREDMPDVFPGRGFLGQGDGVFEVVGDAVDGEGEGFLEHFGGGAGDFGGGRLVGGLMGGEGRGRRTGEGRRYRRGGRGGGWDLRKPLIWGNIFR